MKSCRPVDKADEEIGNSSIHCIVKIYILSELKLEMDYPPSLTRKSVVLSLVLEEITDDDDDGEEEDVVDGIDAHDGLVLSAFKRQETVDKLEQQGWITGYWQYFNSEVKFVNATDL